MKTKQIFLAYFIILFLALFFAAHPSLAAGASFPNPLGNVNDAPTLIGKVINALLGLVGSIALLMFIWGGFLWMTAAGNEEQVKKGSTTLLWATLGLVVIFSAYALVNTVLTALTAVP